MAEGITDFLNPTYELTFQDLFIPDKLSQLNIKFEKYFQTINPENFNEYFKYKTSNGNGYKESEISEILIFTSKIISDFLAELFNITGELNAIKNETLKEKIIFLFKKEFIQRLVFKKYKIEDLEKYNFNELNDFVKEIKLVCYNNFIKDKNEDDEFNTALMVMEILEIAKEFRWFYEGDKFAPEGFEISERIKKCGKILIDDLKKKNLLNIEDDNEALKQIVEKLAQWSFVRYYKNDTVKNWVSYKEPHKIDFDNLVKFKRPDEEFNELITNYENHYRYRDGFSLNDYQRREKDILSEVDYCMYCHEREKDSCSKGFYDKLGNKVKNPIGVTLNGCPLNEKISESHYVRKEGYPLASLALITLDNPMCPGTGHRICNDCMKGCIFQKQEPVNIPLVESSILKEILKLPYGFEIYSLLTRWNPLNIENPVRKNFNGKKIFIVGAGPAGYTLAHYLLNEGFKIKMIDEMEIREVFKNYIENNKPVKNYFEEIYEDLNYRFSLGFGGATEYGITVRWDKNFLNVIYINLLRNEFFELESGKLFGRDYTVDQIWNEGYEHIALCVGAAKPNDVKVKNRDAKLIYGSTEFLSDLQIKDAINPDKDYLLKVKLPGIVIGGGLTAIDCSTELLNYYPVFLEKLFSGKDYNLNISEDEMKIYSEHFKLIKNEKMIAEVENRKPDLVNLLRSIGGVKLVYRKRINDAPSYRENHEEIIECLEQGVDIVELFSPVEFIKDSEDNVSAVIIEKIKAEKDETGKLKFRNSGEFEELPAGTVVIAAGTNCNDLYNDKHPGTFEINEKTGYFELYNPSINGKITLQKNEPGNKAVFTSYNKEGKFITVYGDSNSTFYGSVVKAMASAKFGAEQITKILS